MIAYACVEDRHVMEEVNKIIWKILEKEIIKGNKKGNQKLTKWV